MRFRYDKNNEELIVSASTRIEYHQLGLWLTRFVKGHKFLPAVKMGVWDGKINYFRDGKINIGLWKECYRACREIGASFIIDNKEDFPINRDVTIESVRDFCKEYFSNHKIKDKEGNWIDFNPYDHQIESVFKILKNRYCIGEIATSGGKSLILSIIIFYILKNINPAAKILIIVPSITLVTQLYDDIIEHNRGLNNIEDIRDRKLDILLNNSLYCDIRIEEIMSDAPRRHSGVQDPNVVIGTFQSLEKRDKEFFSQFYMVAVDEAHQSKAKTLISILEKTFKSAYYRFGVSGTFPSDDSCESLTVQSVLGPKITEVSADELKQKGIITPMDIKAIILNHNEIELNSRLKLIRKSGNGKESLIIEKKFIHQSEKRQNLIKKIIETKCPSNTLVLFHTIEYGKLLFEKYSKEFPDRKVYYIDGDVNNKVRNSIKSELEVAENAILIASFGTLSTGVSIKNLHHLIFADSFKSQQIIIQSIGRILRLFEGKTIANIYDIVDVFDPEKMDNILYNHFKERNKFYIERKYPCKEIKINL